MRALVVTLKFEETQPDTETKLEALAQDMEAVDGLLSTYWLRNNDRVMLIQSFESHRAVNTYLDSQLFSSLGMVPGTRDVFVTHYDVSSRLNCLSVLGSFDESLELERELVPA